MYSQKPKKQSEYTPADIEKELYGYTRLLNWTELAPGMDVKYKTKTPSGQVLFRMGGFVTFVDSKGRYFKVRHRKKEELGFCVQFQRENEIYYKNVAEEQAKFREMMAKVHRNEDLIMTCLNIFGETYEEIVQNVNYIQANYNGDIRNLLTDKRQAPPATYQQNLQQAPYVSQLTHQQKKVVPLSTATSNTKVISF
jgi:hypothetical protein